MSMELYITNRLDRIVSEVQLPAKTLFQPNVYLYQNEGVRDFLKKKLTQKYGAIANTKFLNISTLVNEIGWILSTRREMVGQLDWQWVIYETLQEPEFTEVYPQIERYYKDDHFKRLQLSEKLADLFDQYSAYRLEMMENWKSYYFQTEDEHERWQRDLYQLCVQKLGEEKNNRSDYKQKVAQELEEACKLEPDWLRSRFPLIQVFGVDVYSPIDFSFLVAVAKHTEVKVFMFNPAPEAYWYDCISSRDLARRRFKKFVYEGKGNELLLSFGKLGKDMLSYIFDNYHEILNTTNEVVFEPEKSLLGKIQKEILTNTITEERAAISPKELADGSIQLVGNYTEAREVEVLLDHLKKALSDNEKLQLQDILVMTPSIEKYKPYIHAVFQNSGLDYAISDLPVSETESIIDLIVQTLQLRASDINRELVIQLLENELIKKKFGLYRSDLIHHALAQTAFVFGERGSVENDTHLISWQQSKKQLLYGAVMNEGTLQFEGFEAEPYIEAEGANLQDVLQLIQFVDLLFTFARENGTSRTLTAWCEVFRERFDAFNATLGEDSEALKQFQTALDLLVTTVEHIQDEFTASTFAYLVRRAVAGQHQKTEYQGSRILFCNMQSMKGLSHKVIAVLGLNDGVFPRIPNKFTFDLMAQHPEKADRSLKENDKYLFLEALMSAEELFYCSYLSRRAKDNKVMNPSIVIQELLDYLEEKVDITGFVTHYPKEKSSTKYYVEGSNFLTFNPEPSSLSDFEPVFENSSFQDQKETTIEWNELVNYFKHPQKWYINHVLGLYFGEDKLEIPESEKFGVEENNKLEEHLLNQQLLADVPTAQLKRQLMLPLNNWGESVRKSNECALTDLRQRLETLKVGYELEVFPARSLELHGITLNVPDLPIYKAAHSNRMRIIGFSLSKPFSTGKYLLPLWLQFVYLRAHNQDVSVHLEFKETSLEVIQPSRLTVRQAKELVVELVKIYQNRRNNFLPFHPNVSYDVQNILHLDISEAVEDKLQNSSQYDAELAFSFQNDPGRILWNADNVALFTKTIWAV